MRDFSNYLNELPSNHVDALHIICSDFLDMHAKNQSSTGNNWRSYNSHEYQMYYQVASKFVTTFNLDFELPSGIMDNADINSFFNSFDPHVSAWLASQFFDKKYSPTSDGIILTQGTAADIQTKTNELRDMINSADYLSDKHSRSLLRRLEKFQKELHNSISSLDVFLAAWSDINNMVEDTGTKSKPIVDRFREIIGAVKSGDQKAIGVEAKPKQITDQSDEEGQDDE